MTDVLPIALAAFFGGILLGWFLAVRRIAPLRDAFGSAAAQALQQNNATFLQLAQQVLGQRQQEASGDLAQRQQAIEALLGPVRDRLGEVDAQLKALDRARAESQGALKEQLEAVARGQQSLARETQQLVTALRAPQGRGQWGELQLRRCVELAGMQAHADFIEQASVDTDEGRQRPDLLVRMPGGKLMIVDAKAPLAAYLDALEATTDADRALQLDRHAKQVRAHVEALAKRDYAAKYPEAPDFVVLFLPGEAFFSAACQRDPSLVEDAVQLGVIPASPTTLITLLKAVAYGWQQERIAENAARIRDLGAELHDRLVTMVEHFTKVRRGLSTAVSAYNDAVSSLERRVLPSARRMKEYAVGSRKPIEALDPVDEVPRQLNSPDTPPDPPVPDAS